MEQIEYHSRLFELRENYHNLNQKENTLYHLIEDTKGRVKKWGEVEFFNRHLFGGEQHFPNYGYDFYFSENLLKLCIDKTFLENDRYHNFIKAKEYLYENIREIVKDLKESQLWKNEGSEFILDINENNDICLRKETKEIQTFKPISFSEEEIAKDREKRIIVNQKSDFNSLLNRNITYLIKKEKIKNIEPNMQYLEFLTNKFFNKENDLSHVEKFFTERLNKILNSSETLDKNQKFVIHYDSRVGTVLKNENGKFLLRIPEQEQIDKLRNKSKKEDIKNKINL